MSTTTRRYKIVRVRRYGGPVKTASAWADTLKDAREIQRQLNTDFYYAPRWYGILDTATGEPVF